MLGKEEGGSFVSVEGLCEVKTTCPGTLAPLFFLAPLSTLIGLLRAEIHTFPYSNDTKFLIEESCLFLIPIVAEIYTG